MAETPAQRLARLLKQGGPTASGDTLLPPPVSPAAPPQGLQDAAYGMTVQPIADAASALRGNMTPDEAQNFAMTAAMGLITPMARGVRPAAVAQGIRAYHGSPHDFDRFDLSKIGTGEGAQSYGHGLYFAEAEPVAKQYRDTLGRANKQWSVDGDVVGQYGQNSGPMGGAAARLRQVMGQDGVATEADAAAALKAYQDVFRGNPGMIPKAHFDEVSKTIPQLVGRKIAETSPGKMYEVNINAKPEQFLDWDKPLAKQAHPYIQSEAGRLEGLGYPTPTGEALYSALEGAEFNRRVNTPWDKRPSGGLLDTHTAPAISEQLRDAGIPGIKYLDQGSRQMSGGELIDVFKGADGWQSKIRMNRPNGEQYFTTSTGMPTREAAEQWAQGKIADKGTSNYVLFDDKLVDILRKYGIAGATPPTAAALAEALARSKQPAAAEGM